MESKNRDSYVGVCGGMIGFGVGILAMTIGDLVSEVSRHGVSALTASSGLEWGAYLLVGAVMLGFGGITLMRLPDATSSDSGNKEQTDDTC